MDSSSLKGKCQRQSAWVGAWTYETGDFLFRGCPQIEEEDQDQRGYNARHDSHRLHQAVVTTAEIVRIYKHRVTAIGLLCESHTDKQLPHRDDQDERCCEHDSDIAEPVSRAMGFLV